MGSPAISAQKTRLVKGVPGGVEVVGSHEQAAVRTMGTVSGANVIGTLCDIVTGEHKTISLSGVLASISD